MLLLELAGAARKVLVEMLKVEPGETVVITADTGSDWRVVETLASEAYALGAKPLVLWHSVPPAVGKAADPYLPLEPLAAALSKADVWIELNRSWLLYSTPYEIAMEENERLRYLCLVGIDADAMVDMIGRVDIEAMLEFQDKLAEVTRRARKMRVRTPAGTDVRFENDPERPVLVEGNVTGPGEYMLIGQVDWAPIEESIEGTIVFDGSVWPPEELGILAEPIELVVEGGRVVEVRGGREAKVFERWLRDFGDPKMLCIAHISYGCNPGARLCGNILVDERIWGAVEWGLGSQSPTFKGKLGMAASHTDGVCLDATVEGDGVKILENGEYVHPELAGLARRLRA